MALESELADVDGACVGSEGGDHDLVLPKSGRDKPEWILSGCDRI